MKGKTIFLKTFQTPILILLGIIVHVILNTFHQATFAIFIILGATVLGSFRLFKESFDLIIKKQFALDYIAILAITVSLLTGEYIVAGILALMISSGRTLEDYGVAQAKKSLTKLISRIPNEVILWKDKKMGGRINIEKIKKGDEIVVRKGEVIGLDGILTSETGLTDESSLTGEPYTIEKIKGDPIRSGTINIGDMIIVKVTKKASQSTYARIIDMVKKAQDEKTPFIRLANRYSVVFTILTLLITILAFIFSGFNLIRALAVLVIATPCPLIIATPIALLGGVNAASKKHIIVKKLASIEILSKADTLIFDKTGTITLGKPIVSEFKNLSNMKNKEILAIAESIERTSLHPLAKAIVEYAKKNKAETLHAEKIEEKIGSGIIGIVRGVPYSLSKLPSQEGMMIGLFTNNKHIATFKFEDEIKQESKEIIKKLRTLDFELYVFTGDKKEATEKVLRILGENVIIKAECTPEDKKIGIEKLKKEGKITAMVGDGINDAPALALSDVGMVFSNEEQTAASEAADIVFLGGNLFLVVDSLNIAKRTVAIAKQSIFFGIGASILGMIFASFGFIPPVGGAFLQETIDVAVILNALRASR